MKVVFNIGPGKFQLSPMALERLEELGAEGYDEFGYNEEYAYDLERHDPLLVQAVEELGVDSWGGLNELHLYPLKEVRSPGKKEWTYYILEGDSLGGYEEVLEPHKVFWEKVVETINLTPNEREIAERTAAREKLKSDLQGRGKNPATNTKTGTVEFPFLAGFGDYHEGEIYTEFLEGVLLGALSPYKVVSKEVGFISDEGDEDYNPAYTPQTMTYHGGPYVFEFRLVKVAGKTKFDAGKRIEFQFLG